MTPTTLEFAAKRDMLAVWLAARPADAVLLCTPANLAWLCNHPVAGYRRTVLFHYFLCFKVQRLCYQFM